MAEKLKEKFFSEFPPVTKQQWLDKVTIDLKGADFDRKLVWKTNEGFKVQPIYRSADVEDTKNLKCLPGDYPYTRGNKKDNNYWYVRQDIVVEDFANANQKALDVLKRGVDSLGFIFKECKELTKNDFAVLLKDIEIACIELNFVCPCKSCFSADAFVEYLEEKGIDKKSLVGGVSLDTLGKYTLTGKFEDKDPYKGMVDTMKKMAAYPNFKVIEVNGAIFNNSGSAIVQELAFALSAAAEYLDVMTNAGFSIDEVAPKIRFHFATGSKYFMEIAKLRAARYLWSQIVRAYNPSSEEVCKMNIFAETSEWNKTYYDPNINLLRTQTEAMSAVLGGVDSFLVHPFDDFFETPTALAERVARNQQLLLREESHFEKIADIAGGSYYIEELTENIVTTSWSIFLEVQEQGGYIAALKSKFIQTSVTEAAKARDLAIARRRENFVGTNQFPNFLEVLDKNVNADIFKPKDLTAEGAEIETLKPYRGTQAFEILRHKTDEYSAKNGRPVVYMLPMGNLNMRKARAQYSCNYFACAGFKPVDNNGFDNVDDAVKAALENKADIVVLCSSDDDYASFAPEVYKQLKDKAIVVVAGNPSSRPELEAAGLKKYIHVKNNVLEELQAYQKELGIK